MTLAAFCVGIWTGGFIAAGIGAYGLSAKGDNYGHMLTGCRWLIGGLLMLTAYALGALLVPVIHG
jgi:hypothetical protein